MKTRFLLIGLLALIAVACADPELEVVTDKSDPVTTQSVRQRTLEEALLHMVWVGEVQPMDIIHI